MNHIKYRLEDLKGKRFGRLVIEGPEETIIDSRGKKWRAFWCQCDCGRKVLIKAINFNEENPNKGTRSCGCLGEENKQLLGELHRTGVLANPKYKHGLYHTRLNKTWKNMRHRCNLSSVKQYEDYGARGIKVCPEWNDSETGFMNFYNWAMENGYSDDLTIDRIDVDEGYYPWNCRWVPQSMQLKNTRNSLYLTYYGFHYNIHDWCLLLGVDYNIIIDRLKAGWTDHDALSVPMNVPTNGLLDYKNQIKIRHPIIELDMNKIKYITDYPTYHRE